jgi:hypothetical protein
MGATHFRAISDGEIFSACGEARQSPDDPSKPTSSTNILDLSKCDITDEYRCGAADAEEKPQEPPTPEETERLNRFLASHSSRRRAAIVVEAATFDNGMMAAMCTKKGSPQEIEQHAAVLSPSELEFWGVNARGCSSATSRATELVGQGLAQLDWIWEDTLHSCTIRQSPSKPGYGCLGARIDPPAGPAINVDKIAAEKQSAQAEWRAENLGGEGSVMAYLKKANSTCETS